MSAVGVAVAVMVILGLVALAAVGLAIWLLVFGHSDRQIKQERLKASIAIALISSLLALVLVVPMRRLVNVYHDVTSVTAADIDMVIVYPYQAVLDSTLPRYEIAMDVAEAEAFLKMFENAPMADFEGQTIDADWVVQVSSIRSDRDIYLQIWNTSEGSFMAPVPMPSMRRVFACFDATPVAEWIESQTSDEIVSSESGG